MLRREYSILWLIFIVLIVAFSAGAKSEDELNYGETKPFVLYGLVSKGKAELLAQATTRLNDGNIALISTIKMLGEIGTRSFVMDAGVSFKYAIPSIYRCREILSEDRLQKVSSALENRCWEL
ncbi:hypothetical protein HF888_16475 (plasmid) [Bermanella marisrubri]|uniref:Uncharacterized protein n=1 Tax=Bermanella marisrubri TaxID=207949 RepID=Q1MY11_9GAMM|nr:hypothetical protein [Bermanella marisrubri]EAT10885.1 hypothetical protein RED65_02063 [Oceanobacter sp. RED65] [Bermanella marisrubri]QIZ85936.1 hypothetical protein HF888_16475 [Bermanella marisrubri]